MLPASHLEALGFRIAISPVAALLASAAAMQRLYEQLQDTEDTAGLDLFAFDDMNQLMGFDDVWTFEREHAEIPYQGENA